MEAMREPKSLDYDNGVPHVFPLGLGSRRGRRATILTHLAMHLGNMIREEMKRQGRTTVWLARELSCDRTNIYRIYEKPSIDISLLMRISHILHVNYFEILSKEYDKILKKK